jgi:hypothetical protein
MLRSHVERWKGGLVWDVGGVVEPRERDKARSLL